MSESKALEQEPCEDCISRQAVVDMTGLSEWFDSSDSYIEFVFALSKLPPVKPEYKIIEDIKAEIKEWYWQADKQAIANDPCVVDAMVDLFIRTIDKHTSGA